MKRFIFIITILFLFNGCINIGSRKIMKKENREKIKVGLTMEDVKEILGKPKLIKNDSKGLTSYVYIVANIGFYGIGSKGRSINIDFSKDGRVILITKISYGRANK